MLEIHQRYILDEVGTPIAVQIPIAQFETLLRMVANPDQVSLVTETADLSPTGDGVQQAVAIGLEALETGQYTDYDEPGLQGLFDGIQREGRSHPAPFRL